MLEKRAAAGVGCPAMEVDGSSSGDASLTTLNRAPTRKGIGPEPTELDGSAPPPAATRTRRYAADLVRRVAGAGGAMTPGYFFISSLPIESFFIESFFIASLPMASLCASFFMASLDIASLP